MNEEIGLIQGIAQQAPQGQPEQPNKTDNYRSINCDQVHWILEALKRITPLDSYPRVSRQRDMKLYACLYEIMEVAQLKFSDKSARWNGTPNDARDMEKCDSKGALK